MSKPDLPGWVSGPRIVRCPKVFGVCEVVDALKMLLVGSWVLIGATGRRATGARQLPQGQEDRWFLCPASLRWPSHCLCPSACFGPRRSRRWRGLPRHRLQRNAAPFVVSLALRVCRVGPPAALRPSARRDSCLGAEEGPGLRSAVLQVHRRVPEYFEAASRYPWVREAPGLSGAWFAVVRVRLRRRLWLRLRPVRHRGVFSACAVALYRNTGARRPASDTESQRR